MNQQSHCKTDSQVPHCRLGFIIHQQSFETARIVQQKEALSQLGNKSAGESETYSFVKW